VKSAGKPGAGKRHAGFDVAGAGNVIMGAGLRASAKALETPPDPTVGAPVPDPTTDFVRGPRQVLTYLKDALRLRAPRYLGHNPAGGAMVVVMLLAIAATGLSGLALYGAQEFAGPLAGLMSGISDSAAHSLEDIHEFFANFTLVLIIVHLAGVAFSSLSHRENLIGAMTTGFKRRED
jgi:cytochrome b